MLRLTDVLEFLIEKGPGRTELELAQAVFGKESYQQRVNQECSVILNRGTVVRQGYGGPSDPYRYYPARVPADA